MIVTSEAIVLRARKHGETSKIVTLYTRDYGKLNVIAKGAREIKSKFGGALEMFARIHATFYKKEGQEGLYLLSKAELVESNNRIVSSLERIEAATEIIELLIRSMHDEEENQEVFELLCITLHALGSVASEEAVAPLQLRFNIEFARISGFGIHVEQEDLKPLDRHFQSRTIFQLSTGEVKDYVVDTRDPHQPLFKGVQLTAETRAALLWLEHSSIDKAAALRITDRARTQLMDLFTAYFAEHIPGISGRSLKSGRVFSSL